MRSPRSRNGCCATPCCRAPASPTTSTAPCFSSRAMRVSTSPARRSPSTEGGPRTDRAPIPSTQGETAMKVGEIEILPVLDGMIVSRLPASMPYPDQDSEAWREQHGMFRTDGMIESTVGGFLVRTSDHLALVDAGLGRMRSAFTPPSIDVDDDDDPYVEALTSQGIPRENFP